MLESKRLEEVRMSENRNKLALRLGREEKERQARLQDMQTQKHKQILSTMRGPQISKKEPRSNPNPITSSTTNSNTKPAPITNPKAQDLERQGDVADRLFAYGKEKEKRRENLAKSAHETQMATLQATNPHRHCL